MEITLDNYKYNFLVGYQKQEKYRKSFNLLSEKTFELSFENWFQSGYWNEKYIPYTLFDGEIAVANVSANIMDFILLGKRQLYIQIGTVMTDEKYQNKKLCRFLMEKVIADCEKQCNLIYLYANQSTVNLYPKFGFKKIKEYEHYKSVNSNNSHVNVQKLDMDKQSDQDMLYQYAKNTTPFGILSMCENADLVMFYCMSIFKEHVYFIETLDILVVARKNEDMLHLLDVFGKVEIDLEKIIHHLRDDKIKRVVFGFTPKECDSYSVRKLSSDDILFIRGGKQNPFENRKLMFPILSHA